MPGFQKKYGVCKKMSEYGYKADEHGHPLRSECNKEHFVKYYPTAENLEIFDALYTNKFGLTDKYVRFYEQLAIHFANNSNVIGFDPINEPFCANFMKDLTLLFPKNFDK